jgi:hypothetical protein
VAVGHYTLELGLCSLVCKVSCPALGEGKVPLGNVPSRYMRKISANTFIPTKHWCIPLYNKCESFYSFNKCEISYRIEAPLEHCMSNSRKNILRRNIKFDCEKVDFKKKILQNGLTFVHIYI